MTPFGTVTRPNGELGIFTDADRTTILCLDGQTRRWPEKPAEDAPTWTRSERPSGHRSLWLHLGRWHTLEATSPGWHRIRAGHNFTLGVNLVDDCAAWKLPVPSDGDLAWLRGAK